MPSLPGAQLVRNLLNLARDSTKFERIFGLHGCEGRSLSPPTVEQLPIGSHSIAIVDFRVLRNLQQALGKT